MNILFIASECVPYAKTGGLADVVGALPKYLKRLGHEVVVVIPKYGTIDYAKHKLRPFMPQLGVWMGNTLEWCCVHKAEGPDEVAVYFIEYNRYFDREGLYHDAAFNDYLDNPRRFSFLSRAALQLCRDIYFMPDVVHAHDWQTAAALAYLKVWHFGDAVLGRAAGVLTIHNIAYQGVYGAENYEYTGLKVENFVSDIFEDHGRINFLKGGIFFADMVNTVSPTYAHETLSSHHSHGMAPYLNRKGGHYTGILNGVDYHEWNPENDPYIAAPYTASDLSGKAACKKQLQELFHLEQTSAVPIIGCVSRFVTQKGLDMLAQTIEPMLTNMKLQFVILGAGDKRLESFFGSLPARYPGKIGSYIGYSNELSHIIEAGSDFFIMPSLYEPCGLNQIYSLKYGTLPIVRATGGLEDTVEQYDEKTGYGTGFKFLDPHSSAVYNTAGWAISTWYDRHKHIELMRKRAMIKDFSWEKSAEAYSKLYEKAIAHRHGG